MLIFNGKIIFLKIITCERILNENTLYTPSKHTGLMVHEATKGCETVFWPWHSSLFIWAYSGHTTAPSNEDSHTDQRRCPFQWCKNQARQIRSKLGQSVSMCQFKLANSIRIDRTDNMDILYIYHVWFISQLLINWWIFVLLQISSFNKTSWDNHDILPIGYIAHRHILYYGHLDKFEIRL